MDCSEQEHDQEQENGWIRHNPTSEMRHHWDPHAERAGFSPPFMISCGA